MAMGCLGKVPVHLEKVVLVVVAVGLFSGGAYWYRIDATSPELPWELEVALRPKPQFLGASDPTHIPTALNTALQYMHPGSIVFGACSDFSFRDLLELESLFVANREPVLEEIYNAREEEESGDGDFRSLKYMYPVDGPRLGHLEQGLDATEKELENLNDDDALEMKELYCENVIMLWTHHLRKSTREEMITTKSVERLPFIPEYSTERRLAPKKKAKKKKKAPGAQGNAAQGEKTFKNLCAVCHSLVANSVGPKLGGVVGRPIASADGVDYSGSLSAKGGEWTEQKLDKYLKNPADYAPGNRMAFAGLANAEVRGDVIAYLKSQSRHRVLDDI